MPERGGERGAVGECHLLGGVEGREAVPGPPAPARAAGAADGTPVEDHEVAGGDVAHVVADGFDHPGRLVAEQEREVVVDRALAVVQVGVADAARLHSHQRLARPGSGTTIVSTVTGAPFARATTPRTSCAIVPLSVSCTVTHACLVDGERGVSPASAGELPGF